jgi:hypothetical protein
MAVGNYEIVRETVSPTIGNATHSVAAPEGKVVFSGSIGEKTGSAGLSVNASRPNSDGSAWDFDLSKDNTSSLDVELVVICAEMC